MSDPNHIESPPAGANAGPMKLAADQRRIITDRLPVPLRRSRTSAAPASSASGRRTRLIVGGIIALVVIGGGVLLYVQDAAQKGEQKRAAEKLMWDQRFALHQLAQDVDSTNSQLVEAERMVKALTILSKAEPMEFTFLRRFGELSDHTYEAILNGTRPCVLRVHDERLIQTRDFSLKYFTGKAVLMGEKPYRTKGGDRKYSDTYEAVGGDVDAQLANAMKERDSLAAKHAELRQRLEAEKAKSAAMP
jgi:hypothetical protein